MARNPKQSADTNFSFDNTDNGPSEPISVDPAFAVDSGGAEQFDPAIHGTKADGTPSRNADGSYRRKRGLGKTRTAKESGAPPLTLEPVKNLLLQIHVGLAQATKAPELALFDAEAENLGAALLHLSAQYGGKIDPKAEAWLRVTIVAASVYGPRIINIREREAKERAEKRAEMQRHAPTIVEHPFAVPSAPS